MPFFNSLFSPIGASQSADNTVERSKQLIQASALAIKAVVIDQQSKSEVPRGSSTAVATTKFPLCRSARIALCALFETHTKDVHQERSRSTAGSSVSVISSSGIQKAALARSDLPLPHAACGKTAVRGANVTCWAARTTLGVAESACFGKLVLSHPASTPQA